MTVSRSLRFGFIVAVAVALAPVGGPVQHVSAQSPGQSQLGTIDFPTSAKPAAQGPFLTGVKAMYNFEFDIAGEAFRESGRSRFRLRPRVLGRGDELQPSAVGATGSGGGPPRARALAPTAAAAGEGAAARNAISSKPPNPFGAGDKLAATRPRRCVKKIHAKYPKTTRARLYALALLGTRTPRRQQRAQRDAAAAIAQEISSAIRRSGRGHHISLVRRPDHAS